MRPPSNDWLPSSDARSTRIPDPQESAKRIRDGPGNQGGRTLGSRALVLTEYHPPPLSTYSAPGGLRQDPGRAAESPAEATISRNGGREMRVLSTYDSRGDEIAIQNDVPQ